MRPPVNYPTMVYTKRAHDRIVPELTIYVIDVDQNRRGSRIDPGEHIFKFMVGEWV